ncbi:mitochondrial import receptor subunit TOM70 [Aplysia californica]|uniref:Mitochondrial import receptor subunit TOM70 n=1 Tax=Aplysia californica TaxID=6500 RepID=A0ABM0JWR3_APLCA|nr:mitochondrial import receptor subunit TOM70 [Aplysia californica]
MATFAKFNDQLKDITEGWSKWQIAACVGAPIALGLAGLWYYNRSKSSNKASLDLSGGDLTTKGDHAESKTKSKNAQKVKPPQAQGRQELAQLAKTKGNKCFKEGKYEEAIACYTEAIKTCPPDIKADMSTFYQNRAAAFENLKKFPEVVEDCDSALELNPRYSKALARRSKAREQLQKYRESLEDITKACLIEGFQNQTYLQAADRVLKTLGKSKAATEYKVKKPTNPSTFYVENYLAGFVNDPVALGFPVVDQDNLKEMGITVKENIGENGAVLLEKPGAFERAKACLSSKEYDQVVSLCDEELSDESSSSYVSQALLLRGTMRLLQGMGDAAFADLDRLGGMEGVSPSLQASALIRAGSLQMQKDASENALSYFEKAESVDPKNSDVFHHFGQQLLQLEKLDEAIKKFDTSIELSPDFPTSYVQKYYAVHRKAIVTEDLSLLTKAKTGFEETIQKFPQCSDALILYAQALSDQGNFADAEKFFKKAQEVQPRNANNVVHRGLMTLQWKGDVDQTLKLLEEALRIDPTCQYAFEIRGTIEVQRGNLSEAVKSFKQAIALSNSESEMAHLFSLMEAAEVQVKVARDLNIQLPSNMM